MISDWTGKRVTVMGLGRFGGGVGVTRWLAEQGARVTVTDLADEAKLADSVAEIRDLDVRLRLGGHDEADFRDADLVIVNPAVKPEAAPLRIARDANVPISTEINLFVERCRGRTIGITGTAGKSTVTAMTGHILERAQPDRRTWVGGNLGRSLLNALPEIRPEDWVVLELSSFQLERTPAVRWSPHIALITNVTPNHLDWHGSFAAYLAAKLNIVRFQNPGQDAIVIHDEATLRDPFEHMFGDFAGIWRYALDGDTPVARAQTKSSEEFDDQRLVWDDVQLQIPGEHNRLNAAAALTIAHLCGVRSAAAVAALAEYEGLPHRLRRVAQRDGVTFIDDSKSTTPEATQIALNAVSGRVLVILGGYDKGSDLTAAARSVAERGAFAACVGVTGPRWVELIRAAGGAAEMFDDFASAVAACKRRAEPGDTVLLSPGCASWGMFADYRARGLAFAELVQKD